MLESTIERCSSRSNPVTCQSGAGSGFDRFTQSVAFATGRNRHEQGVPLVGRWEIKSDECPANPLSGLAVVEITNARIAADPLIEEVMQRSGTFIEIEPQKGRML